MFVLTVGVQTLFGFCALVVALIFRRRRPRLLRTLLMLSAALGILNTAFVLVVAVMAMAETGSFDARAWSTTIDLLLLPVVPLSAVLAGLFLSRRPAISAGGP